MTRSRQRRGNHWPAILSVAGFLWLLLLWVAETYTSNHFWTVALLTYAPPFVYLLLPLALLLVSLIRHQQIFLAGLNLAACLFALFALLGLRLGFPPARAEGRTLRVMTYNVEQWTYGADAVASVIRSVHPDIVCLQEAGDYWYVSGHPPLALAGALPGYHFVRQGEIMVGSRFPLTGYSTAPLPPGSASRPAVEAHVETPRGLVTVIAVHLLPNQMDQHLNASLPSECRRFASARVSQDKALLAFAARVRTPLLICGDFNAQPQTASCRRLTARYPDAFDRAGRGFGYTIPSGFPMMRIDHILTGNGLAAQCAWVPNLRASDHRPLVVENEFTR